VFMSSSKANDARRYSVCRWQHLAGAGQLIVEAERAVSVEPSVCRVNTDIARAETGKGIRTGPERAQRHRIVNSIELYAQHAAQLNARKQGETTSVDRVADEPGLSAGDILAYEHAAHDERTSVDPGAKRPVFRNGDGVRRNGLHILHLQTTLRYFCERTSVKVGIVATPTRSRSLQLGVRHRLSVPVRSWAEYEPEFPESGWRTKLPKAR
jgi:hypothetical protein